MTTPRLPSLTIPPDLASPPYLAASPHLSRSRSAHGLNAATGRPAMWTPYHQRTLACLYLYTDLSLKKIIDVVFRRSPSNRPIGTDSANKNLNHLLDKEPRWLHPKSREDMGSRLEQLALSSSQISSQSSSSSYDHHLSDLHQISYLPVRFQSEGSVSPSLLAVPHHIMGSYSAPASPMSLYPGSPEWSPSQPSRTPQPFPPPPHPKESQDRALFDSFLRRATVTSSSTSTSTSSLKTVLADYSAAYRGVIKGLLRRIPGFSSTRRHASPISDASSAVMDWLDDEAAPTPYEGTPFPLPGDFLSVDEPMRRSPLGGYQMLRLVSAAEELARAPAEHFPWVTNTGLTDKGKRILNGHILESDWLDADVFDNTLLHFVAVRGGVERLHRTIILPQARGILQKVNTAGQTFFHVMDKGIMQNKIFVPWLVGFLRQESQLVNIYAQDHYGRNFFHMLKANHVDPIILNQILEPNHESKWNTRDAFGAQPRLSTPLMTYNPRTNSGMLLDSDSDLGENGAVTAQLHLVTFIGTIGSHNATEEYSQGCNRLHCLAAANLSLTSGSNTLKRSGSAPSPAAASRATTAHGRRRSGGGNKQETDSSDRCMNLRLDSLKELLGSGVPTNAYDAKGNTPLMAFAAQLPEDGNNKLGPEMIKLLIEHGGDVHARNRAGETALLIAVRCGRKLAARTLVDNGANVYARDAMGNGVLEISDAKMMTARRDCPREYARFEACRAWLSGQKIGAMHNPSVLKEWGRPGVCIGFATIG